MEDTLILIWQAQQAAEHGDKVTARNMLRQALHIDPNNGLAWEWMARLAAEPEQRRYCLERLLMLEPKNPFGLEQQLRENYSPQPPSDQSDQTREMTMQVEEIHPPANQTETELPEEPVSEERPVRVQQPEQPKNSPARHVSTPLSPATAVYKKNPVMERLAAAIAWIVVLLILVGVFVFMAYQYFPEWFLPSGDTSLLLIIKLLI